MIFTTPQKRFLKAAQLETPLGMMLAIADEEALCFLEFINQEALASINRKLSATTFGTFRSNIGAWEGEEERWLPAPFQSDYCHLPKLERKIKRLVLKTKSVIAPGMNEPLRMIQRELKAYFKGKLQEFQTPLAPLGSPFQQEVWSALLKIPYGVTKSYAEQATVIGNSSAVRAVANANGANQLAIVIPCHRIISSSGSLGGYGGGLGRKEWLIQHEKDFFLQ
ncbi:MAG: hypothetical protein A3F67_00725 [Verrucomicrobia bacterium RIFCSPHIGHO2_12_FULL_41_10]|nr:MAG: hypothetical protein A3F67_00725 [Verrucomicrobia bacterium RIFCSPHIGHO2_12_FULL_41_10]HLB33871.1 methylated-DNA--[protein]-cysteine S-methyltransferase [Chthoniobacterales bacterium]